MSMILGMIIGRHFCGWKLLLGVVGSTEETSAAASDEG